MTRDEAGSCNSLLEAARHSLKPTSTMSMEMLSQMRFKELQSYAKANGCAARDVNMACERRELLNLIQQVLPASPAESTPDNPTVTQQLVVLDDIETLPAPTAPPIIRRDLSHRKVAAQAPSAEFTAGPSLAERVAVSRQPPTWGDNTTRSASDGSSRLPANKCPPSPNCVSRSERIAIERAIISQVYNLMYSGGLLIGHCIHSLYKDQLNRKEAAGQTVRNL
jgi:hypothetical protein